MIYVAQPHLKEKQLRVKLMDLKVKGGVFIRHSSTKAIPSKSVTFLFCEGLGYWDTRRRRGLGFGGMVSLLYWATKCP